MRITADEARAFWTHPTQQEKSRITPETLPDDPVFQYLATDGVCGAFHPAMWPGVWMAHYGVKPETWGKTLAPARAILNEFWISEQPELIVGWTHEENRQALAFARRLGFKEHGRMELPSGTVIMQGYKQ